MKNKHHSTQAEILNVEDLKTSISKDVELIDFEDLLPVSVTSDDSDVPTDSFSPFNPVAAITLEIEKAERTSSVGILTIKTANQTVEEASRRPNPRQLYLELWHEGEVCCLFADSNLGKSIFAVQMADKIAREQNVLYVDCELSDKQFQMRYSNQETSERHIFPEGLFRAEINPYAIGSSNYEESIIADIEAAAAKLRCRVIIIDNLSYLCNSSDKGVDAGLFMMKLMNLKKKCGLSLLVIAHTPKRDLSSPITQNHLAGSKKLYNFFDSVFAIGQSAQDKKLRYIKQVKVRAGAFRYDENNVLVYEVEKLQGFLCFSMKGSATEKEHLRIKENQEAIDRDTRIMELSKKGLSCREIAQETGLGKSTVSDILRRTQDEVSGVRKNTKENSRTDSKKTSRKTTKKEKNEKS